MQELAKVLEERYGISIKNISANKDCLILNTPDGRKKVKKSVLLPEKLQYIHEAKEHLFKNGFEFIDRYIPDLEGRFYADVGGINYVMTDLIDGRECNFDNSDDVLKAARLLAQFHSAATGLKSSNAAKGRDDLGKLPVFYAKRLEEIKKMKKAARREKSKFDYLFLEHVDYFCKLGEEALEELTFSNYGELAENARERGSFCHHDFTHHNIIFAENKIYLTNFEFCCNELGIYDLANLLRRKMRKCNWNVSEAKAIIVGYNKIKAINRDEMQVLKVMLQFPQKFWRVVNKYYNSKRSWSCKSYISKLQEVIGEAECHGKFLKEFATVAEKMLV